MIARPIAKSEGERQLYRMLIVDDEPIIVDGLHELFVSHPELEVYRAYNGFEALDIIRGTFMDIVLADIEMPGMNGLQLQAQVMNQWPRCKFIFLTGYSDFSYIHTSVRQGAFDYVLKTEGDDPIIAAVDRAVAQLQASFTFESLIRDAESKLVAAAPLLRKEYWLDMLGADPISEPEPASSSTAQLAESDRSKRFAKLGIALHPSRPVFMAIGRVDGWREGIGPGDRALFLYSVNNIADEILAPRFLTEAVFYAPDRVLWLIQPREGAEDAPQDIPDWNRYLLGLYETAQAACSQYLKLPCSFVVNGKPTEWEELAAGFERLSALFVHGLGSGKEMLLSERHLADGDAPAGDRGPLKRLPMLEQYLEQKDEAAFFELYSEIMQTVPVQEQGGVRTSQALEIYYAMAAAVFSYVNRFGLLPKLTQELAAGRLFGANEFNDWQQVTSYFEDLFRTLFGWQDAKADVRTNEVVRFIYDYVDRNLSGDLSLVQLADKVYLTPFYLSRLFKQKTGRSLSDYITERRVGAAKKMLADPKHKIHEVGERIGFESASYFARFFKKLTGLTPQEYRDSLR